ncbi:MAG: HAD-IIB family hydrolase [Clostridia bacterium]|nr:HAD-IIB family hydrolase [Clostridia bacterium]MDQ7791539.1 HAD-IIB family hydrolase [Clostridia bacterium]
MTDARLILIDLDGCLLPGDFRELDYHSLTSIREYCASLDPDNQPKIALCTGRPQPYASALLTVLGAIWPEVPSVVESGAYLYYPAENRIRMNPVLTTELLAQWRKAKEQIRRLAPEMSAKPGVGEKLGLSLIPAGLNIPSLFEQVCVQFADCEFIEVTYSSMCVDITPRGVNKRSGIQALTADTGIDPAHILAIGDSANDLSMLETVGIPTCPANAQPEVKAKCVYVSPYPYTTGVWDIITRYGRPGSRSA